MQRVSLTYDLGGGISVNGGAVAYSGGGNNPLLNAAADNDRLFVGAKWSF